MNAELKEMFVRIARWPREDQEELAQVALEIEARRDVPYHATREELELIDEAVAAVERGEIATEQEVETLLSKFRRG
jgi:hypothetical protein